MILPTKIFKVPEDVTNIEDFIAGLDAAMTSVVSGEADILVFHDEDSDECGCCDCPGCCGCDDEDFDMDELDCDDFDELPYPINVIRHGPATIVFWDDGDKTVAKLQPGDVYDQEKGLMAAMLKKYMGNEVFQTVLKHWCPDVDPYVAAADLVANDSTIRGIVNYCDGKADVGTAHSIVESVDDRVKKAVEDALASIPHNITGKPSVTVTIH